jgi:hypothetical protein
MIDHLLDGVPLVSPQLDNVASRREAIQHGDNRFQALELCCRGFDFGRP